jgi:CRP-like cAMP-binding protein
LNAEPEMDFRVFAREACPVIEVKAGDTVFQLGEAGATMYVILSGRIEMMNGDRLIESLGADEAFGMMSLIDALRVAPPHWSRRTRGSP